MCRCSLVSEYLVAVGLGDVGSWNGEADACMKCDFMVQRLAD